MSDVSDEAADDVEETPGVDEWIAVESAADAVVDGPDPTRSEG